MNQVITTASRSKQRIELPCYIQKRCCYLERSMIPYTCNDTHKICSIFLGRCQIDNKILRYNVEEMIEEKTQGRKEREITAHTTRVLAELVIYLSILVYLALILRLSSLDNIRCPDLVQISNPRDRKEASLKFLEFSTCLCCCALRTTCSYS